MEERGMLKNISSGKIFWRFPKVLKIFCNFAGASQVWKVCQAGVRRIFGD
jgi:hypothetical protein